MQNSKQPKILAPAGSFDSLTAAIKAGADAVYFGIADFNMRASAARNFKKENLGKIVKQCKKNNVETNLTVNTVLYNQEIEKMKRIIDSAKDSGIDAIICADQAAIQYGHSKGLRVNISTQVSVSNTETVKFYSNFADRIILARELTLNQVQEICNDIKKQEIKGPSGNLVEIEVFAHGALCVAVSGRCAMSLYHYNTSANRGRCAQICRRRFRLTDIETNKEVDVDHNYIMSSADLCTIGMLPEIVETGVDILKFEGRGRPPEYVKTVVTCYKEALDAIADKTFTEDKVEKWNQRLGTVFNRGFCTGFYMGRKIDEWAKAHGSKSTEEKTIAGYVEHYYDKIKVAHVKIDADIEINNKDKFLITGPTTGAVSGKLTGMMIDDKEVNKAKQGDDLTFKVPEKVRKNDKFFIVRRRNSFIPRGKEKLLNN
ncbi:U32 family peptidase [Candidatus Dojkabacteria bacterium]|nr:U32 family peptidase [Candidatus Dojkabacteria bacterium]